MLSLVSFLAVLSILVLVHEFGHFAAAKRIGVRVERFSFGFGPALLSFKGGETEYLISAIPLGGYVKMAGEDPSEKLRGRPWEFLSRKTWERFTIIFMGPLLNYFLSFVVFSAIFMFGSPTLSTEIGGLMKDYPAEKHGLRVGDKVLAIDGKDVKYWEDLTGAIHRHIEGDMTLLVERQGQKFPARITPMVRRTKDIFGNKATIALIGITPSQKIEKVRYGPLTSFYMGARKLIQLTAVTCKALWSVMTGRLSMRESMTGPIGIFFITGQAAKLGFVYILHLMAILSASLAIFNMLPLPVLDGGHIIFLMFEKLRGRPLSARTQEAITNVGIAFLVALTLFIFYSDMSKFGIFSKMAGLFRK